MTPTTRNALAILLSLTLGYALSRAIQYAGPDCAPGQVVLYARATGDVFPLMVCVEVAP